VAASVPTASATQPQTSCHSVVHIGDSTSDGLVLPAYQPDAALRIATQYRDVGVTNFIPEVSGARSLYETWHGIPNGYTVAQQLVRRGYVGCWVIALGTNDAADVAVGSAMSMPARIEALMKLLSPQPVMWVNVITLLNSGPYSNSMMQQWNRDLLQACVRYPNMRVYNWAAVARPSWFIPDGIHYTPYGYAQRSRDIAQALVQAFPAQGLSPRLFEGSDVFSPQSGSDCLVS
jgi:lysophospholipase L1-like esterase